MVFKNSITELFTIDYPIIQGGMVWASGWRLASAVSNAGGLGLIGAGSMYPNVLQQHIRKCKDATKKPFGVNIPLLSSYSQDQINVALEEGITIFFTSAGNPSLFTRFLKDSGCKVIHVISSSKFAVKAYEAGCDAVVAEGFEAGGHNGREETTTMVLVPQVVKSVPIPVIAAGGIVTGAQVLAAFALGASGVQIGSRFVASEESSSHINFKRAVIDAREGDTELVLKKLAPVRLLKNTFYQQVKQAEEKGASFDELKELLGKGRAKEGMHEGNLTEGELEIGQASSLISDIKPVSEIMKDLLAGFNISFSTLKKLGD